MIIGLIFLRYISDAFEDRHQELVKEGKGYGNPKLKGVLPKNYGSPDLDKDVLSDVVAPFYQ